MGDLHPFDRERRPDEEVPVQDLAQAEMARFEEELSEAKKESSPMIAGIWPAVEPWYARVALGQQRVFGVVEWGEAGGTASAYGDLSAFTDEGGNRRGLEGDLNKDPTLGPWLGNFVPMHLRIERVGDQKATAEVTILNSPTGARRVIDSPFSLKSTEGASRLWQQEGVRDDYWTYLVLTDQEPHPDLPNLTIPGN